MRSRIGSLLAGLRLSEPVDRRAVIGALAAVLPASLAPAAAGAEPAAERCLGIGKRCGRKKQPACSRCCTGYAKSPGRRRNQRRCSCIPDFQRCRRGDQCCSGLCEKIPCAGINRPICLPGLFFIDEQLELCEPEARRDG